jgi:hypothetical protein
MSTESSQRMLLLLLFTRTVCIVDTKSAQLWSFKVQVLLSTFDRASKAVSAQISTGNITAVQRHKQSGCCVSTSTSDLLCNAVLLLMLLMALKQTKKH